MNRIILILAMCMAAVGQIHAQKISELKNYDTMVHVYKLNYEQTKYLLKDGIISDTSFLFTKKYKEYPRNKYKQDTLPEGHFLIATINDNQITYNYFYKTPFTISPKVIEEDVILYLFAKNDKRLIKEAKVEIDGKAVKYDAGYGGYSFPKKSIDKESLSKNKVFLKVSFEGEIYVFTYNINEAPKPSKPSNYYDNTNSELVSPGYLITDKPLYKPLDALNIKSFLIKYNNGNPLRKKAFLSISESGQNFYFSKKIKRTTPGAFEFKWQIPDTLKLDRDYQLKMWYKKNGRTLAKYKSFKLEEYELNKNKYALDMPNDMFFAGDDVKFYVTAKDMNGFPVQGTRIHYSLQVNELLELFVDSMSLTQSKKNTWIEKDTVVEYENFMELKIPSESLPKANARYTLQVTFVDPLTYEKKAFSKVFLKYDQKEKLLFYQQEDSVHVRNLYNGKDANKNYYFITTRAGDTISRQKITTPFHYKLKPEETNAIVIDKDSFQTVIDIKYNKLDVMHAKGKRTGDSIQISFAYPFASPIHYRIYKKDKLVKSGESATLNYTMLDKSADDYRIVMTTNLQNGIEDNFYEMKFVPEKNLLHFEKKIASSALPGDSMAIELKALDYKNQPVHKVNIAAYAVNAAFADDIQIPYVDVLPMYQNKIEINPIVSKDAVVLKSDVRNATFLLKNNHLTRFNLRKNEYYLFKYPLNEMSELQVEKQQVHPEFSVVLIVNDKLYSPRYILLDGQPIFISDINMSNIYSFASTAGKHVIKFRYFDKTYELKNVNFKEHTKHLYGINVDSIKKVGSKFVTVDSLTMLEPTADEKKILYSTFILTNPFYVDTFSILSTDSCINMNNTRRIASATSLNIDGDSYMVHGPFPMNSMVKVNVNNKKYNLQTGIKTVYHYDYILKDFVPKPLGGIKGAFLHFSENQLQMSVINSLLIPDTSLPMPIAAPIKYKPETANVLKQKEEESFYQEYRSTKGNDFARIIIDNRNDSVYVKSVWMITPTSFESCDFIQNVNRVKTELFRKNIELPFDLYLLFNNNKMAIWKNVRLDKNSEFYINSSLVKTENFDVDKIEVPLKIYSELNAVPLLPFYDAPFETKETIKQSATARNNIYLHGMITDNNRVPLQSALVYVELNGKYKYGAVTNSNGMYEILDMIPATYQLKVYHPEYKISHIEPKLFESKQEYQFNTSLTLRELYAPLFEVVQADFRMLAFVKKEQSNMLKLTVHEKETRTQLENVQVKLLFENEVVKTYTLNGNHIEIPFIFSNEEKVYSIEISKIGYTTLRLNNIEFVKKYSYVIESFLGLEKKEILKKKEYDVNMQGRLSEIYEQQSDVTYKSSASNTTYTVTTYRNKLIDPASPGTKSLSKEQVKKLASVSTGDFAAMQAGVYQNKAGYNSINAGGDRASGTVYMVDGIQMTGSTTFAYSASENNSLSAKYGDLNGSVVSYANSSMIDQVIANKNTTTIRKTFSDVGYWKPNILTNKNGIAVFTIKLPDNITSWKSYIIGVGKHWLHGVDSAETKVYKPLQTISIVPSYFYKNDKLEVKYKYQNLTKEPLSIQSIVRINGTEKVNKMVPVKNTMMDSLMVQTSSQDTIAIEIGMVYKEKYKDFEHYDIPVLSTAMKYYSNRSLMMEKDSTYVLSLEPNTKGTIIFNNSLYEKVIATIDELNKYEYGCVEQTASKVSALLVKDQIQKQLKLKTNNSKEIYMMLARLADMQNADGSFGWWRKNGSNHRMTVYLMEVSYQALKSGYNNNIFNSTSDYIIANYSSFSVSDKLYAYNIFLQSSTYNASIYSTYAKINTEFLNTTDKLYYLQNKIALNEDVKKEELYAVFLEMNSNANRPYYDNFFYDYRADLFKAYTLFKNTPFANEFITQFKKKLIHGQYEKNLNTYAKAKMIEALMLDAMSDTSKPIQSNLVINDTLKIKTFPFSMPIAHSKYNIKHLGGDVFVNTSEEHVDESPSVHDSIFSVRSTFKQNNREIEEVQSGLPCQFEIDIQSYKKGEHVMVEIPIPSGMKVMQKNMNYGNGDYVEYYKHKVVYYFEHLPMGVRHMSFELMPLFKGEFVLPAAKASLMYYPFVFGNTLNKKVTIK